MNLIIISPTKKISDIVVWIEAETITGNYIIQPDHVATTLILIKDHPFTYCLKNGKQEIVTPAMNSILHVTPQETILLLSE